MTASPPPPPGYIRRTRANHVTDSLVTGIENLMHELSARVRERCATATNAAEALAFLEEETNAVARKIEALRDELLELAALPEH